MKYGFLKFHTNTNTCSNFQLIFGQNVTSYYLLHLCGIYCWIFPWGTCFSNSDGCCCLKCCREVIFLARCSKLDPDHVGITGVISENTEWGNPKVLQSQRAWRTHWLTALGLVHVSTMRKKKQAFDKGTAGVEDQTATEAGLGNTADLLALVQWKPRER